MNPVIHYKSELHLNCEQQTRRGVQLEKKIGALHQMCGNERFIDSSAGAGLSCWRTSITESIGRICSTLRTVSTEENKRKWPRASGLLGTLFILQRTEGEHHGCWLTFLALEHVWATMCAFHGPPAREVERERFQTLCSSRVARISMSRSRELVSSFQVTFQTVKSA